MDVINNLQISVAKCILSSIELNDTSEEVARLDVATVDKGEEVFIVDLDGKGERKVDSAWVWRWLESQCN